MEFIEIKDEENDWEFVMLGLPVKEIKANPVFAEWDFEKMFKDDEYHSKWVKYYIQEAERWSGNTFKEYASLGFLKGYWWVRAKINNNFTAGDDNTGEKEESLQNKNPAQIDNSLKEDLRDTLGETLINAAYMYLDKDDQASFDEAKECLEEAIMLGYDAYAELGELYLYNYVVNDDIVAGLYEIPFEMFGKIRDKAKAEIYRQLMDDILASDFDLDGILNWISVLRKGMDIFAAKRNKDPDEEWEKFYERMKARIDAGK